ncbi:hypothetical protein O0235_06790 [Tepidiforma flava]|uniref:Restriction endonuclease n=1 Tax=Tepidiforma flava TaxID=3004094 RepID=A0ABY7MCR7_9CHLR|nr:hypothetical protein [Tepidiforma flava]WBL37271.1 hypothetical protein O0235_06790 [Tepidiforma flava]
MELHDIETDLLQPLCRDLESLLANSSARISSVTFEEVVAERAKEFAKARHLPFMYKDRPYAFPDIVIDNVGIEVKFTNQDTWRGVANSVLESSKVKDVREVYVIYGKAGGLVAVRWAKYKDVIVHVRTSHVPRFEIDMDLGDRAEGKNIWDRVGISYDEFSAMDPKAKMRIIRDYARMKARGHRVLWWLPDDDELDTALPAEVRLFQELEESEKRRLRAEVSILCPEVVSGGRNRRKYTRAAKLLVARYGVVAPQLRDLFSAGSVALRGDPTRGGNYVQRAMVDIEKELEEALLRLSDELILEFWGDSPSFKDRKRTWLAKVDRLAVGWVPSEVLFR